MLSSSEILMKQSDVVEIVRGKTVSLGSSCYEIILNGERVCPSEYLTKGLALKDVYRHVGQCRVLDRERGELFNRQTDYV